MDTAVRLFLAAIALLAMVNDAHADSANAQAEASRDEVALDADGIDSIMVKVGTFVVVVYGKGERHPVSGTWARLDTARGYVKAIDQQQLILALKPPDVWPNWTQSIALERIQTLTFGDSEHAVGGSRETPEKLSGKTQRRDARGRGKRIAFKLVSGTLSGIGVSFGGLFLSSGAEVRGWAPIAWSVLIGYPVGSAIGVSLVDPHDRFIHSLIGSLLGVGVATPASSDINFLIFPPILATLASELFRSPPKARRFSVDLIPNPKRGLSAVATLRF